MEKFETVFNESRLLHDNEWFVKY